MGLIANQFKRDAELQSHRGVRVQVDNSDTDTTGGRVAGLGEEHDTGHTKALGSRAVLQRTYRTPELPRLRASRSGRASTPSRTSGI